VFFGPLQLSSALPLNCSRLRLERRLLSAIAIHRET
jgi:hypothetical protein